MDFSDFLVADFVFLENLGERCDIGRGWTRFNSVNCYIVFVYRFPFPPVSPETNEILILIFAYLRKYNFWQCGVWQYVLE